MIRRLLRYFLRAGLLASVVIGLIKVIQSRREAGPDAPVEPWRNGQKAGATIPPAPVVVEPPDPPRVEPTMLTSISDRPRSKPGPGPVAVEVAAEDSGPGIGATWVEPKGTSCPATHPVKAKLASGIYHLPGMAAYERTRPDRCYPDAGAAEADGLTRAKR